ncbi:MAG: dephospho-CoA kinase [Candidatus Omnitrophota bacterium]
MGVYGLTGSFSSGKSTVCEILRKKGVKVFSSDKAVHRYYDNKNTYIYKRIAALYPQVLEGSKISRKKLANIVFSETERLKEIELLVHPVIIKELKNWIKKHRKKYCILVAEVPLLFEKKLEMYFDKTILVWTKQEILLKRINKKLSLNRSKALRRLRLAMPIKQKLRKSDFIIANNTSIRNLKNEVSILWKKLKEAPEGE